MNYLDKYIEEKKEKKKSRMNIGDWWAVIALVIFTSACYFFTNINIQNSNTITSETTRDLSNYPTIYSYGDNLKEIYTNPLLGTYIYLCPQNSQNKANINLLNGIYIEKPTAKVNNNTVQNIFIFDKFPDIEKFESISDYNTLINNIIAQDPIMGFHRAYIKIFERYYNQAFIYEKDKNQYIFYDGASGSWQAQSSSNKKFTVYDSSEYTGGMWNYKEKSENKSSQINQSNLQDKIASLDTSPELQAQYKAEIERAINNGVIKAKKEIDKQYKEADEFYTNMISHENYSWENYEKYESYSRAFEGQIFGLYMNLIDITEKYTKQHKDLATDYYGTLADYVDPTMKKYHVSNLNKLTELERDMAQKSNEIDIRAQGIYKMVYGTNQ